LRAYLDSRRHVTQLTAMTLTPLLTAPFAIQIHVYAALVAIVLGTVQFIAPKGTMPHRAIGWVWIVLLAIIGISSFWIEGARHFGPFSLFHLLSVYTLWSLWMGARAAMRGDVESHKSYMAWLFGLSIIFSAVLAVVSGGVLWEVVTGDGRRW
jgi:uncharacterized membrane protein